MASINAIKYHYSWLDWIKAQTQRKSIYLFDQNCIFMNMNWSQFFVRLIIWLHKNWGAQLFVYACILTSVCTRVLRERATHSELFKNKPANISNSKQQRQQQRRPKIVRAIFNSLCISWFFLFSDTYIVNLNADYRKTNITNCLQIDFFGC